MVHCTESVKCCAVVRGGVLWRDKKRGSLGHMISVLWCTVEVSVKGVLFGEAAGSRVVVVSTPVLVRKSLCVCISSVHLKRKVQFVVHSGNVMSHSAVLAQFVLCYTFCATCVHQCGNNLVPREVVCRIQAQPAKKHICLCQWMCRVPHCGILHQFSGSNKENVLQV